jgi:uncharacterized membrane protein
MSDRVLRLVVAAIAMAGVGIAAYLTYARFADAAIACTTGGCQTVQASRYAELLGIPVALLGLAAYIFVLGTAGVLFGAYLLLVQLFVIEALCQWCVASDFVLSMLALACLLRLGSGQAYDSAA